jgi:hypothetical protein
MEGTLVTNDIQQWAQALLEFLNLRFVVIDTTSIKKESDILHLLILDRQGCIRDEFFTMPLRYPGEWNTEWTGLTLADMGKAPIFSDAWPDIRRALRGKFVLAYGLDLLQERLDNNVQHYGLQPIHLIGDCLMQTAVPYFRPAGFTGYNLKLQDACARIGHILPDRPNAEQRARGQLALLKAMSQGITSVPAPTLVSEDEDNLGDLEANPF